MMAFTISTVCIHGPLSEQKSGIYRTASNVKFHPSAQQQMCLFHPFSASLPHTLPPCPCSPSLSLFFPFPFFSAPTLKPGDWRGSGCTCRVAEALVKESMCFWKSLRRFRPLHVPVLSLSAQALHIRQLLSSCALFILSLPLSFSFLSISPPFSSSGKYMRTLLPH